MTVRSERKTQILEQKVFKAIALQIYKGINKTHLLTLAGNCQWPRSFFQSQVYVIS